MPNWCMVNVVFHSSDKKAIYKIHDAINEMGNHDNDAGLEVVEFPHDKWLGTLMCLLGYAISDFYYDSKNDEIMRDSEKSKGLEQSKECRGTLEQFIDVFFDEDLHEWVQNVILRHAWAPPEEMLDQIVSAVETDCDKNPVYWDCEAIEPLGGVLINTNTNIFPYEYICQIEGEESAGKYMGSELIDLANSVFKTNITDVDEAFERLNEIEDVLVLKYNDANTHYYG